MILEAAVARGVNDIRVEEYLLLLREGVEHQNPIFSFRWPFHRISPSPNFG